MIIKIKGYLTFRDWLPEDDINLSDGEHSITDVLMFLTDEMDSRFAVEIFDPDKQALEQYVSVLLNGVHTTHLQAGLDTLIKDGDVLSFFPPIAGG
jgi:molybdopterin synthase sulfur carrier subunit